jgi:hypothetical protein
LAVLKLGTKKWVIGTVGNFVTHRDGRIPSFASTKFSSFINGRRKNMNTSITILFDRDPQVAENVVVLRQGEKGGKGEAKPKAFVLIVSRRGEEAYQRNTVEATHVNSSELTDRNLKWPVDDDGWDWGENCDIIEP